MDSWKPWGELVKQCLKEGTEFEVYSKLTPVQQVAFYIASTKVLLSGGCFYIPESCFGCVMFEDLGGGFLKFKCNDPKETMDLYRELYNEGRIH